MLLKKLFVKASAQFFKGYPNTVSKMNWHLFEFHTAEMQQLQNVLAILEIYQIFYEYIVIIAHTHFVLAIICSAGSVEKFELCFTTTALKTHLNGTRKSSPF